VCSSDITPRGLGLRNDRSQIAAGPQPWRVLLGARGRPMAADGNTAQNVTEEPAMHPTIHRDLMQARVTDLHRDAERDRLAQAASRARRA
jgi:hypothetical protein